MKDLIPRPIRHQIPPVIEAEAGFSTLVRQIGKRPGFRLGEDLLLS